MSAAESAGALGLEFDDPLEPIREYEEEVERLTDRDDTLGLLAEYLLALAREDAVDNDVADALGLPRLGGDE